MKMRDKKIKKVNRIVKAGLALLCAGALLGGAVFGGGSVRVKAEGGNGITDTSNDEGDATSDVRGMYFDSNNNTYYVAYIEKEGWELVVSDKDNTNDYQIQIEDVNLDEKIRIIWDTSSKDDDAIENQINSVNNFYGKCNGSLDIKGCRLPSSGNVQEFEDISDVMQEIDTSDKDVDGSQLEGVINRLMSDSDNLSLDTADCNIVVILTDESITYLEEKLEERAIVYIFNSTDMDQDNWSTEFANEIDKLKIKKVKIDGDNASRITKNDVKFTWKSKNEGSDEYAIESTKVESDRAVIEISSKNGDEPYVEAYIGDKNFDVMKDNDTNENVNNVFKFYIKGNFEKDTEQDKSDNRVKIKFNKEEKEYDTGLVESKGDSQYEIVRGKTECADGEAYIYIKSDDESDPENVVAIVNQTISLDKDSNYTDDSGENITKWVLSGSYYIVPEDSEDGIQIEVNGKSIGSVNLKEKTADTTVGIEHITSTDEGSYVFFSSKDDSGDYAPGQNSSLYTSKLKLSGYDVVPEERNITYNIVWDLGADSYSNDSADIDDISDKINGLTDFEGKNSVNIVDCDGDKIDFSEGVNYDENKKLTREKLNNILNNSESQEDAYIVVTDSSGIEDIKGVIASSTDKLIFWINITDSDQKMDKEIADKEIIDDDTGVDKWDNTRNLIESSRCFLFANVELALEVTKEGEHVVESVKLEWGSSDGDYVNVLVVNDNKNIIDKIWSKLKLWQKILIIAGAAVVVVFIVIMIIVSTRRKKARKRRKAAGGIPHGSPSSSPDVQLRSGVSPTAQTNVLARRAGEQNMQGMQNTVPANNTKQIQIQIIGRNPKIINTYINGSIFVGRANTCDVFINDATISRQHFALECVNGEVFIQPLVATNGTKLNGQRINDKHPLYPNDRIQIGTIGIIVRW